MAFKMKGRPIIQGTTLHKASIARAETESIVAQTRTTADPSLVAAGAALGKSYVPAEIDYALTLAEIDAPEKEEKKKDEEGCKQQTSCAEGFKWSQDECDCVAVKPKKKQKKIKVKSKQPNLHDDTIKSIDKKKGKDIRVKTPKKDASPRIEAKPLPTKKEEAKLRKSIGTVETTKSTDRFEEAAKRFGYDISTVKGYKEAEEVMEYRESTDEWINPKAIVGDIKKKTAQSKEDKKIAAEVAAKAAETMKIENERQATKKAKEKEIKDAEKLTEKTATEKKEAEIEEKNIVIRERNQLILDAREHFGSDVRLTPGKLDEYRELMKTEQDIGEIEEEDDQTWQQVEQQEAEQEAELEKIAYKPQVLPDEPATTATKKPKSSDYRWGGTGGWKYKGEDKYKADLENWKQSQSPADMRDDRIWRNAIKGGALRSNMRKSGYVPRNEQ